MALSLVQIHPNLGKDVVSHIVLLIVWLDDICGNSSNTNHLSFFFFVLLLLPLFILLLDAIDNTILNSAKNNNVFQIFRKSQSCASPPLHLFVYATFLFQPRLSNSRAHNSLPFAVAAVKSAQWLALSP